MPAAATSKSAMRICCVRRFVLRRVCSFLEMDYHADMFRYYEHDRSA